MKTLRVFFAILGLFVLIGIFIVACFVFFMDPNRLKPVLVDEVMKKTGYRLEIEGDLSWSLYPRFGVHIAHMTFTQVNQAVPFLDLRDVNIATALSRIWQSSQILQGEVYISYARFVNLHAQEVRLTLNWQNQVLTLQPLVARLYNGMLKGTIHVYELPKSPRWDTDLKFNHVDIQSLLQDLRGSDNKISVSGWADGDLHLSTQGTNREQILNNLNGMAAYRVNQGALLGIDCNYWVQSADALVSGQSLAALTNTKQTSFDQLTGNFIVKNGEVNHHFILASSHFTVQGEGNLNLINETIDDQLDIIPLNTSALKWTIPVLIEGPLRDPTIRLDMLKLKAMITQEQIEKVKTKVQKEIKKLPEQADKLLKNIFGN